MTKAMKGNTKLSSKRVRRWCMTINNYTDKQFALAQQFFDEKKSQYIIGKEIGKENGTKHLQIYVEFPNGISLTRLKKVFPTAHLEHAKGTKQQNFNYCSKDGDYHGNISFEWKMSQDQKVLLLKTILEHHSRNFHLFDNHNDWIDAVYVDHKEYVDNIKDNNSFIKLIRTLDQK